MDVVRGVALFGILLMNIVGFAHPMGWEEFTVGQGASGPNYWAWFLTFSFFEGTQRTLFSLLFGAGVIILTSRAEARGGGVAVADIYYRRNIWLIVFGMINAYLLLWEGDILYYYGIAALFLFPLRNVAPRNLIITGLVALAVLVGVRVYDSYDMSTQRQEYEEAVALREAGEELDEEQVEAIENWEEMVAEAEFNEETIAERIADHTESYATVFMRHLPGLTEAHGNETYRYMFLDGFSMMVIGMALLKLGVLNLRRPSRAYWLMVLVGYGVGLPVSLWETRQVIEAQFNWVLIPELWWTYDLGRLGNALGHLGLLLLFVRSGALAWLQERLAAVGRMALSNYIMHSVIALLIFLRPGLGLYGAFERYQLYVIVALICLFQLLVSKIWLDHYRFGPLEWAWRSLTYRQKQPMRRVQPEPGTVQERHQRKA